MNRRRLLSAGVGLGATLLAGCIAAGSDPTPTDGGPSNDDVAPTILDTAIETTDTDCMSDRTEGIDVTFDEDAVRIRGVATAPTPCHEATLESATVDTDTLRVETGLDSTGGVCVECVGAVAYTARVDLEDAGGVETVVVEHEDPGERHHVSREEASTPKSTASPSPDTADTDPVSHEEAMQEPDADLAISIENRHDEAHEVEVTVARASGDPVFTTTERVEPGAERGIYNLEHADPDGVEAFTIEARMGGQTESIEVETSACYGPVEVGITEEGELYPVYAIC